jgi:glycosyltransferase involved in cell wall biosynthesis
MYILIDGYNLSKAKGTGVANYGKQLARMLSQAGHEVGIIFPYNFKFKGIKDKNLKPLLASIDFNSGTVPELKSRKLSIILYTLQALLNQYKLKEIPINQELVIPKYPQNSLSEYRILYKNAIFQLAHAFFNLTNQLLPVKVPSNVDLVHWTYPIPIQAVNKPNIYTIHDLVPMRLPYTTLDDKKFYAKSMAKICQKASKIVTVSNHTKKDLCNFFNVSESKVFVSWQSTDITDYAPQSFFVQKNTLKSYKLFRGSYFIFIGNVEPKKNVKRLIQAYLVSNVSEKLIIVGSKAWKSDEELAQFNAIKDNNKTGNNNHIDTIDQEKSIIFGSKEWKRKRELDQLYEIKHSQKTHGNTGIANKIKFLEYLPQQEMVTLLANARALIFPSLYEGFGLPVLEAMELGVPVLTSNTSSLPEVAGDAALYVNPYNIEEISLGIHKLSIDDELCQKLSDAGLKRAQKFNTSLYQQKMIDFYESIIKV